jgi:hypothetical protein
LTLILSGAVGNMIDRVMNGFVVDFIDFHYQDFYWPIFNFADIFIGIFFKLCPSKAKAGFKKITKLVKSGFLMIIRIYAKVSHNKFSGQYTGSN